jgi:hypothetical protein
LENGEWIMKIFARITLILRMTRDGEREGNYENEIRLDFLFFPNEYLGSCVVGRHLILRNKEEQTFCQSCGWMVWRFKVSNSMVQVTSRPTC